MAWGAGLVINRHAPGPVSTPDWPLPLGSGPICARTMPGSLPRTSSAPAYASGATLAAAARARNATNAFLIGLPPFAMHSGNARISQGCCERGTGALGLSVVGFTADLH